MPLLSVLAPISCHLGELTIATLSRDWSIVLNGLRMMDGLDLK